MAIRREDEDRAEGAGTVKIAIYIAFWVAMLCLLAFAVLNRAEAFEQTKWEKEWRGHNYVRFIHLAPGVCVRQEKHGSLDRQDFGAVYYDNFPTRRMYLWCAKMSEKEHE